MFQTKRQNPTHHHQPKERVTDIAEYVTNRKWRRTGHIARMFVCWLVACLTSQQHASVSQGRICRNNCTCCHTKIEIADPTFYLTQSQYTDTGPNSPSADPITPGAWQGSRWKWTRTAEDKVNCRTVAEGCFPQWLVGCLLACLTFQQHASVSQGPICSIFRAAILR